MKRLFAPIFLLLPLSLSAQDLVEFQNGQVADADDMNANLNFLLEKIDALESRVMALEPAIYDLDLDGDGLPNDCTYSLEYLVDSFQASERQVSLEDGYVLSSAGSVRYVRLWEFEIPAAHTIGEINDISIHLDVKEVRPNPSSDLDFGVTDGESFLHYRNNGTGNGGTSPVLISTYSFNGNDFVYEYPESLEGRVNFAGLQDYRVTFDLSSSGSTVTVFDKVSGLSEIVEVPYQNLNADNQLSVAIHAQESNESYKVSGFGIAFPDADTPSCK